MINYGEQVVLDVIDEDDLELLLTWRNDYHIWRTCRQNDLITWEHHLNWFKSQSVDDRTKMYIIKTACKRAGVCGLTNIDYINSRAEFSCYIKQHDQHRGYGTAALKTLISHGFNSLNLNCIWGETFLSQHTPKMFKDIGFTHEGTRRQFYFREGRYVDAELFSILKSDWIANPNFKKEPLL